MSVATNQLKWMLNNKSTLARAPMMTTAVTTTLWGGGGLRTHSSCCVMMIDQDQVSNE
jgi:hypothetical protein